MCDRDAAVPSRKGPNLSAPSSTTPAFCKTANVRNWSASKALARAAAIIASNFAWTAG